MEGINQEIKLWRRYRDLQLRFVDRTAANQALQKPAVNGRGAKRKPLFKEILKISRFQVDSSHLQ